MMRLVVLGLLACAVSLSDSANITVDGMPVLWEQAVNTTNGLPTENGIVRPNPFDDVQRMSLYKILMASTDWFMDPMGTGENLNPMWGLALQLAWMKVSGRLEDPTNNTNCGKAEDPTCVSADSWWACENYLVSVLPFLSAAHNNFCGEGVQVQMDLPEGVSGFCKTHPECSTQFPDAMQKWDNFFTGLISTGAADLTDDEKKENILSSYWDAQMASTYAASVCNASKSHYSDEEVAFSVSWMNLTDYVEAVHFHSSLEKAKKFIIPLPSRVLKTGDVAPNIEDLSAEENKSLHTFAWLDYLNTQSQGSLVSTWKSAMCTVASRATGAQLLDDMLSAEPYSSISFMSVLAQMTAECYFSD